MFAKGQIPNITIQPKYLNGKLSSPISNFLTELRIPSAPITSSALEFIVEPSTLKVNSRSLFLVDSI